MIYGASELAGRLHRTPYKVGFSTSFRREVFLQIVAGFAYERLGTRGVKGGRRISIADSDRRNPRRDSPPPPPGSQTVGRFARVSVVAAVAVLRTRRPGS